MSRKVCTPTTHLNQDERLEYFGVRYATIRLGRAPILVFIDINRDDIERSKYEGLETRNKNQHTPYISLERVHRYTGTFVSEYKIHLSNKYSHDMSRGKKKEQERRSN